MTPDQYCESKAASSGSSFYWSFRFLPTDRRRAITALYAFCREVDDVVDECREPAVARVKLDWWRAEVARCFDGDPQHPVTRALVGHLQPLNLQREYFDEIIDGMEMDLDRHAYADFSELSLYCYRAASVVGLLAAEIFGYEDRSTLKYAEQLGMAFQLTNILRDVREDAERGRIYLPADELDRYGVRPAELGTGRTSEGMRDLFEFQAERARDYYRRAFAALPAGDRHAQRSGIIMAEVYLAVLAEIEADGYRVTEHRVRLTPLRKLWIAIATARRERRRQRRLIRSGSPA